MLTNAELDDLSKAYLLGSGLNRMAGKKIIAFSVMGDFAYANITDNMMKIGRITKSIDEWFSLLSENSGCISLHERRYGRFIKMAYDLKNESSND